MLDASTDSSPIHINIMETVVWRENERLQSLVFESRFWIKFRSLWFLFKIEYHVIYIHPALKGSKLFTAANYSQQQIIHSSKIFTVANYSQQPIIHSSKLFTAANYSQQQIIHISKLFTAANYSH